MSLCGLCKSNTTFDDSFTLKRCQHIFCHKCLHDYIRDHLTAQIKCPNGMCQKNIPDQIIRKCLSNDQTQLFDNLSILSASKDFRKCLTKDCPKFVSVEKGNDLIYQCNYCDQPNCLKCQKRHYPNDCGRNDLNENDVNHAANEAMKRRKKEALEDLCKSDEYIEYPEAFECTLCYNFILPRSGIILRQCFHYFCRNCFNNHIKNSKNIGMLTCLSCKWNIDDREVIEGIGAIELKDMICKLASPKLFSCKTPDCKGLCDKNNSKSTFTCPFCLHVNCLDCEDIHEGLTCNSYRKSQRYKDAQEMKKTIEGSVKCKCGQLLIRQGGCAALKCPNCSLDICFYTGKIAGNKGPDSCGCTTTKPCVPQCIYGCLPE